MIRLDIVMTRSCYQCHVTSRSISGWPLPLGLDCEGHLPLFVRSPARATGQTSGSIRLPKSQLGRPGYVRGAELPSTRLPSSGLLCLKTRPAQQNNGESHSRASWWTRISGNGHSRGRTQPRTPTTWPHRDASRAQEHILRVCSFGNNDNCPITCPSHPASPRPAPEDPARGPVADTWRASARGNSNHGQSVDGCSTCSTLDLIKALDTRSPHPQRPRVSAN